MTLSLHGLQNLLREAAAKAPTAGAKAAVAGADEADSALRAQVPPERVSLTTTGTGAEVRAAALPGRPAPDPGDPSGAAAEVAADTGVQLLAGG